MRLVIECLHASNHWININVSCSFPDEFQISKLFACFLTLLQSGIRISAFIGWKLETWGPGSLQRLSFRKVLPCYSSSDKTFLKNMTQVIRVPVQISFIFYPRVKRCLWFRSTEEALKLLISLHEVRIDFKFRFSSTSVSWNIFTLKANSVLTIFMNASWRHSDQLLVFIATKLLFPRTAGSIHSWFSALWACSTSGASRWSYLQSQIRPLLILLQPQLWNSKRGLSLV